MYFLSLQTRVKVLEVSVWDFVTFYICMKILLLCSVTEDYPEVKAAVLTALEEAKHISIPPHDLYPEVLGKYIKEVCQKNQKHDSCIKVLKHSF